MNIKQKGLALGALVAALGFAACQPAATNTVVNTNGNRATTTTVPSNVAVAANNNANVGGVTNSTTSTTDRWTNTNSITRADYDKNRADWERDRGTSTIGQGANDSWLWFKTRSAMLATNDLRESTINVDVNNDVITLKGTVANAEQKAKAETVAKGIDGNKGVKNELQIKANDSATNQAVNSTANMNAANKR